VFSPGFVQGAGWNFQTPCRVAVGVVGPPNFSGATGTYFLLKYSSYSLLEIIM
jgi:hypothetical protein